jgi:hypothetical protein
LQFRHDAPHDWLLLPRVAHHHVELIRLVSAIGRCSMQLRV